MAMKIRLPDSAPVFKLPDGKRVTPTHESDGWLRGSEVVWNTHSKCWEHDCVGTLPLKAYELLMMAVQSNFTWGKDLLPNQTLSGAAAAVLRDLAHVREALREHQTEGENSSGKMHRRRTGETNNRPRVHSTAKGED